MDETTRLNANISAALHREFKAWTAKLGQTMGDGLQTAMKYWMNAASQRSLSLETLKLVATAPGVHGVYILDEQTMQRVRAAIAKATGAAQ